MLSASAATIKQSLNKAYGLIIPKRADMDTFKANLVKFLNLLYQEYREEKAKIYLMIPRGMSNMLPPVVIKEFERTSKILDLFTFILSY